MNEHKKALKAAEFLSEYCLMRKACSGCAFYEAPCPKRLTKGDMARIRFNVKYLKKAKKCKKQ